MKVDVFAVAVFTERVFRQVDAHAPRDRESDNQRRTHQKVCLNTLMNTRFEISVSGQDARGDEIMIGHDLFYVWIERTGISDASGATITDQIKAKLVEILLQAGLFQILSHHARSKTH